MNKGIIDSASHALRCIVAILNLREESLSKINKIKGKQKETTKLLFEFIELNQF